MESRKPPVKNAFLRVDKFTEEEERVLHVWNGTAWHRIRVVQTQQIRAAAVAFGDGYGRLLVPVERRITQFLLGNMYLPQNFTRAAVKRTWCSRDASGVVSPVAGEEAIWSRAARCPWCQTNLLFSTSNAPLDLHRRACNRGVELE